GDAPVEILRDANGIPHIFARSIADAYFGLGFVHAQDRLWQMETSRRIGSGRIAEVVGAGGLGFDRLMRTLGLRRTAQANLAHFDAETRSLLDAYTAGVNAFLATDPVLPPEFWLARFTPEPWSPVDSVLWTKVMALDLGGNWRNELLRMQLAGQLPVARIQELIPPYPGDAPPAIRDLKSLYGDAVPPPSTPGSGGGSNSWVVSGARTASGKPLLANDPHLPLTAPPVWYFAHLSAPGLDVIGATLPGVPGVVIGRNDRVAWGFTNTGPDVQDLYLEKVQPDGRYVAPDGPREFTRLKETIAVKGAPAEELTIRISRHGPVISDVQRAALPAGQVLALAWTALAEDDLTMQAVFRVALARDWSGFLAAARDYQAPQQTISYADVDGNIGFIAAGRVPIRKSANDLKGLAPAPGWDARYDWAGSIPFDQLPRLLNPASNVFVSANQKIVPPGYRHFITSEWQPPYRAGRIAELVEATPKHTRESFARMQADIVSPAVRELLPRLLATPAATPEAKKALAKLAAWDGTMSADRPEPLIVVAWWRELTRAIYADELGASFAANWSARAQFVSGVLSDRNGEGRWCDNVTTEPVETCPEILAASLERALTDLRRRYGDDPERWRWGEAHAAWHRHRPFSRVAWLAPFFDIKVPTPGDAYTVNVGQSDFADESSPYTSRHAASLRAIYDLGDPQASVFIHSAGQSGNPLSPHYSDFTPLWARGEYVPMLTERARIEARGVRRLVLAPRR
ncbi:MAG TPA: penicillin acylase family protein, partial [Burkholderiales bacterium]|nr:penicillin acylase family protein [Burkholderiales bacterium]